MHQFQRTFWLQKLFLTITVTCWPELPSRQPEAQVLTQAVKDAVQASGPSCKESQTPSYGVTELSSPPQTPPQSHRFIRTGPAMGARPLEALCCNRARYSSQHLSQETLRRRALPAPYGKQSYRNSLTPPGVQSFLRTRYSPGKIAALFCFSILTWSSKLPSSSFKHAFSTASHGVKPALTTAIPAFGSDQAD